MRAPRGRRQEPAGNAASGSKFKAADRRISIIICSIDETKQRKVRKNYETLLSQVDHEFIFINDAKSLCEGYNRAIERSTGDILVFSHDDIEIVSPDFANQLMAHLETFDVIGIAGTDRLIGSSWVSAGWPYIHGQVAHHRPGDESYRVSLFDIGRRTTSRIQALDGLFFAVNRRVIERLRFDEQRFDGFHLYDLDFTFTACLEGFELAVCSDIFIIHESGGGYDDRWKHYGEVFEEKFRGKLAERPDLSFRFMGAEFTQREELLRFFQKGDRCRTLGGAISIAERRPVNWPEL